MLGYLLGSKDLLDHLRSLLALERHLASGKDEDQHPHRPHVTLDIILLGFPQHLGGHVAKCATSHLEEVVPYQLLVGEPKVNQSERLYGVLLGQQDVFKLDVGMNYTSPVHVLESPQ